MLPVVIVKKQGILHENEEEKRIIMEEAETEKTVADLTE